MGASARLPGLCAPSAGAGAVPPGLHDGGQPAGQGVLPAAGRRHGRRLRLSGGPGPVRGGADRHQALERSLRPAQPGRPRAVATEVLRPDLQVHR